ncbi:MAG: sirohydrochlorin cobaltochelatase, partial [Oscillospiraceae bacterium]
GSHYDYAAFVQGSDEQAKLICSMVTVALNSAKAYYEEKHDKTAFVKAIISDNILLGDIYVRAKELHFASEALRAVFLVRQVGSAEIAAVDVVQSLFSDSQEDFVISINETDIAVIKTLTEGGDGKEIYRIAKSIEDALQAANPDWSVRRAFTAQIIINHVQARDGEKIDNMTQALDRAVANGVKNLVVQPTHLMHGAEYDEMCEAIEQYKDKFESVSIAEPLLGEVGSDATVINADKEAVAKAITAAAVADAGFESLDAAKDAGTAFVFMGHGTAHVAKVTYSQMQTQMQNLGYENVFIGTVEGEPEETACEAVIEAVKAAGYTNVVLRPLMVVAGDHANNDMAGSEEDSWKTMFEAAGFTVDCQIHGLGEIADVQALYVAHTKAAIDSLNA